MKGCKATGLGWFVAWAFLLPAACTVSGPQDDDLFDDGAGQLGDGGHGGEASAGTASGSTTAGPTTNNEPAPEPECPNTTDLLDPSSLNLQPCPTELCSGGAYCVPKTILSATFDDPSQLEQLADCDADSKCVPELFIATQGRFIPESCESLLGAEGRCLSECIPQVTAQLSVLPQATCAPLEKCVPCYDPQTAQSTGACDLSCDPGPSEPPTLLPKCCDGIGTCVPTGAVPPEQLDKLGSDTCPQAGGALVCAPDVFVNDLNYQPVPCETVMLSLLFGATYKPGVCLPACLPDMKSMFIGQDGCQDGFKCAPCYQPGFFGPKKTGACDL